MKTMVADRVGTLPVTSFRGMQPTGITICEKGRMFVCFPRWRDGVPYSVTEVLGDGSHKPYPDERTNRWENGDPLDAGRFVCVQAVLASCGKLYVLDTKNPSRREIIDIPAIYMYDLYNDQWVKTLRLTYSVLPHSYVNDLRVDELTGKIFLTDSGAPGLIVVDSETGENYRVLDRHPYTEAETDRLMPEGRRYDATVHADGIAIDRRQGILFFHALSGYTLYGIPIGQLVSRRIYEGTIFRMRTPATDGMIMDQRGYLYMGDLERNAIVYCKPGRTKIRTLAEGGDIRWPDSFAIYDGDLYFTNSRIPEAEGDISRMEFTVNKIKLPL